MSATDRLDEIEQRANAATEGPWEFATAPAEGSDETKAEYMARALTEAGPLYALFVPETVGQPGGYLVPAVTGDGPSARNNAAFIAHARTDVPALVYLARLVQDLAEWHETKAYKARSFPGQGQEAKAAQVHEDAARRIRAAIETALNNEEN